MLYMHTSTKEVEYMLNNHNVEDLNHNMLLSP